MRSAAESPIESPKTQESISGMNTMSPTAPIANPAPLFLHRPNISRHADNVQLKE